jgi:nucleoside-diphosphate-sugar epimerase
MIRRSHATAENAAELGSNGLSRSSCHRLRRDALRYGGFYGDSKDGWAELVRKRWFPIIGDGGGMISWIHLEDAAAATVLAVEHDGPAIYNIVDEDPAPVRE